MTLADLALPAAGSPTAAPASWRRRTRSPRSALGARYGYRAFECDVKLSADGVPFLLHDADAANAPPTSAGLAGERCWDELSRLDAGGWHSRAYAGEPLPSLKAIAAFVQRNGFALNIEIKPTPGTEAHTGAVVAAEVARLWHGQPRRHCSARSSPEALRARDDSAPELPRALLLDTLPADAIDLALQLGCVAVVTNHKLMDAALVARIHAAGLRAMVYTVNEPQRAQELPVLGHRRADHRRRGPLLAGLAPLHQRPSAAHTAAALTPASAPSDCSGSSGRGNWRRLRITTWLQPYTASNTALVPAKARAERSP